MNRSVLRSQILTMTQLSCLQSVLWASNLPLTKGLYSSVSQIGFQKEVLVKSWTSEVQKNAM